jgi:hypothetical protein
MSSDLSLGRVVDPPLHREEACRSRWRAFPPVVLSGTGAAAGTFMTKQTPALAPGIPVIASLAVLMRCETERTTGRLP